MATLIVATVSRSGADIVGASAAGGGDAFANDGYCFLSIKNGDSSSMVVTVVSQATLDGLSVTDLAVTVGAGVTKAIGPFPASIYNDANGLVQCTYSSVTSLTVKALKFPPA